MRGLVWVSVSASVVGFFLPWARIDLRESGAVQRLRDTAPLNSATRDAYRITVTIRQGARTLTGDLPSLADLPRHVSGVQIPQVANQEHAQLAIALLELLTNTQQRIGLKSYAVYLVPVGALLSGLLLTCLGRRKIVTMATAILCAGIAGVGFWKLLTTNTHTLFIAITIGPGLWLSLWAYVGLAAAATLYGLAPRIDTPSSPRL